eukprot:g7424.t1
MDETAGTDEDRRVMALAEDLRISSDINPHELLSLRTTTPLESDDELDDEDGGAGEEGGGASSRGGGVGGGESLLGRHHPGGGSSAAVAGPPSYSPGQGDAAAAAAAAAAATTTTGDASSSTARRHRRRLRRRRRQRGSGDDNDDALSDSSSSAASMVYPFHGDVGGGKSSNGTSGTSSWSAATGDNDGDTDSWMRSPSGGFGRAGAGADVLGVPASSDADRGSRFKNNASSLRFLGGGDGGRRGGGGGFSEDTASSSSATLSLQLPFSEDEAALLNVLGQTFNLPAGGSGGGGLTAAAPGGGGGGGGLAGLAALQQRRALLEGLGLSGGEAMWARTLDLKEELAHLERRREALEGELTRERARHESQIQTLESRWMKQVGALKKANEMTEIERDTLEARLRDKKDMYKDLALSDALARELRRVPEEDQTIKEYVSLKAYDLVASSKGELERTRRELEKTQEQLLATTEAAELARREDARARRLATAREEGLKVDLEALKGRTEEMSARAREAQRAADENREKGRAFDEQEAQLRTARMELDAARALAKSQAEALVDVAESEKAAARTAQDAAQRSAMLEMDKTYLQRELSEAQSRADRLGRESDAQADRLRDLERAKDALAAELVSVRERTRSEHEERLEAEVGRLREQSAKELADIRASGREVYERENETLREARKDTLQECARLRSELGELQRAHEDVVMAMAKSGAAHETAIGEVRSELRLKSFELSQLGVAHAEKCSSLRQAGLELDMLREQVAVHRSEFAELEASTTRKTSELQLLLEGERDKVRAFEDLELEVDDAVMRTGREMLKTDEAIAPEDQQQQQRREYDDRASPKSPPTQATVAAAAASGEGVLGSAIGVAAGGGAAATAATIPMAPHRRLRQAVLLAHKLLKKEGELEVARRELADLQSRAAAWQSRASRAEGLLETVEQPTKYMLDSIRSKDVEIDSLRSAQHRLLAKTEALERACREAAQEKTNLGRQLKELEESSRRAERARSSAEGRGRQRRERHRNRSSRSPGDSLSRDAGAPESEAGGSPARAPTPAAAAASSRLAYERGRVLPSSLLSEKLTVHGGRGVADGGPRWYSYRSQQSHAVRVPS